MNLGAFVAQVWLEVRPIRRWKAKRAAKKAAKHPEAAEAVNGEYFNDDEEIPMFQGFKSLTGLLTIAIGFVLQFFGIGDCTPDMLECVTSEALTTQIMGAIDHIVLGVGALVTAWGVIDKARREKKLKRELEAAKGGGQ